MLKYDKVNCMWCILCITLINLHKWECSERLPGGGPTPRALSAPSALFPSILVIWSCVIWSNCGFSN